MSLKIKTAESDLEIDGGFGHSLLSLAQQAGVRVNARCAGAGFCGGCTVILRDGQFVVAEERIAVTPENPRQVLACQARLAGRSATIRFPRSSVVEQEAKIDEDFRSNEFQHEPQTRKYTIWVRLPDADDKHDCLSHIRNELRKLSGHGDCPFPVDCLQKIPRLLDGDQRQLTVTIGKTGTHWSVIEIEPGDASASHFGVAVDIGTTTVVAMLLDLNQGQVLNKASSFNQQIKQADDVASRITFCRSADNVRELQRLVIHETINPLIERLCGEQGISAASISRIAVSGNTVMSHLFLGISPESIGYLPFQPVVNRYDEYRGRELELSVHPNGLVDVVPSVSGYVGGDIVSDLYVSGVHERPDPTLLVDIGTNGEIVYAEDGAYSACATAAGPAFEGYGTAHGCRAASGAIEHIKFARDLNFDITVIGGGSPTGLCGSAFIDFIADGMKCGLINQMGRLDVQLLRETGKYLKVDEMCGPVNACVIAGADQSADNEVIYVSEQDVAQILKAKAAIYAGMKTLLAFRNRQFADINRFCLAGGFARHLDLQNAVCIGLLPEIPINRFDVLGNGSLAGAMRALVDADAMDAYVTMAKLPDVVELNRVESFESEFIDALALPNLNSAEFPNVMSDLQCD